MARKELLNLKASDLKAMVNSYHLKLQENFESERVEYLCSLMEQVFSGAQIGKNIITIKIDPTIFGQNPTDRSKNTVIKFLKTFFQERGLTADHRYLADNTTLVFDIFFPI